MNTQNAAACLSISHPQRQPLLEPVDAIVFDCDGTLAHIEGIDELAHMNGVGAKVQKLTEQAMNQSGINPELFQQRLDLVRPTRTQLTALTQLYIKQQAPNLRLVIDHLLSLKKALYILSSGLLPAVQEFGQFLGFAESNIFAVPLQFDAQGCYQSFDHNSPLVQALGKRLVLQELLKKHPRIVHIGDGMNDYIAHDVVTRFIGYGGAYYRSHLEKLCPYYIRTPDMLELLPLCLMPHEFLK